MEIYTVFHTYGVETVYVDTAKHDQTCEYHRSCEIKNSFRSFDEALSAIAKEIGILQHDMKVTHERINDDNLMLEDCWAIRHKNGYSCYFIVKRILI